MPGCGSGIVAWATARISAGGCGRSPARSALVTTTAHAPSVSRQKSNSRSGDEIIRDAEVVVEGERAVVHLGERVGVGPGPAGERDACQLFGLGAELGHVALGEEGEHLARGEQPVGDVELVVGAGATDPAVVADDSP